MEEARQRYEQALTSARELGDRGTEGEVMSRLADLERLALGDPERALARAEQAEQLLAAIKYRLSLGLALCRKGQLELASGQEAR